MNIIQSVISLSHTTIFIGIGILGIGFLIGFHELGHFLFCKLFNISTPSFSIGMGPQIFKKKIGDTKFILSAIPLGGYVEIAGSAEVGQGKQKEAKRKDKYSFATKPYWQKMLVMSGGILFNLLFAYIVLSALYFFGMPKSGITYPFGASNIISSIEKDSPIQERLHLGDAILAINEQPVTNAEQILNIIGNKPNQTVQLLIKRDDKEITIPVTVFCKEIPTTKTTKKRIGCLPVSFEIKRFSLVKSIQNGIQTTNHLMYLVVRAFKTIFVERNFNQIGGPLMVISQTIKGAEKGIKVFLLLLAFISVNLAILNLFPLPILDGGQALFYTIEAIIRKPLPDKIREYIHYASWILILLLILYLSVKDIFRIWWAK